MSTDNADNASTATRVPKFAMGKLVATPGALAMCHDNGIIILNLLRRHESGDWGDICDEDKGYNDAAVINDDRIISSYDTPCGKLWIITEWDRSVTTVLKPEEY